MSGWTGTRLSLYYFHLFDGQTLSADEIGLKLASIECAYLEATAAARAMWYELLAARRNPLACAFEITDEGGTMLMRLDFSELLDGQSGTAPAPTHASEQIFRAIKINRRRAVSAREDLDSAIEQTRRSLAETNLLLARLGALVNGAAKSNKPAETS